MDKAALSFILSSSDSECDADEAFELNDDSTSGSDIAKRKRSVAEAATPVRKGSKFCTVEGCSSRAKHAKRCWKHGGSVKCKIQDCINRAKSKGVCWSHGGGTVCSLESCDTIAVSHGFCWAHGGGKRCQVPSCSKPAYERTQNYCQTHFDELDAAGSGAF
uniref:WRKY19-like zinc finger domain-containing protein n=1 Tax=Hyaloperonospora arabidopsidis (strain Emoy2) TaxID=559515 RepID=M4BBQ3_HYAAE